MASLDIALLDDGYNANVGRYGLSWDAANGGDVAFDNTQAFAVLTSVACKEKGYWANPQHGTKLHELQTLTRNTPSPTPSQAQAMALNGVAPLVQANLIVNPQASTEQLPGPLGARSILGLSLAWSVPGSTQTITRRLR